MKKMRRLIPAVAMLMVAAVMLSTASFAWFTMNEEVTASGMQIQAKATGSLLISQEPFTDANIGNTDVVLNSPVENLFPMAYKGTTFGTLKEQAGLNDTGWYKPTENKNSNTATGANDGPYTKFTEWDDNYQFSQVFYIATAGETFTTNAFDIVLTAPVCPATGETHKAYAAAIYVINEGVDAAANTWTSATVDSEPTAILYVGESTVPAKAGSEDRNKVTITSGVTIPSIAGAVGDNKVGLKVEVHFYVDGALKTTGNGITINKGYTYSPDTEKYSADKAYYTFAEAQNIQVGTTDVSAYYVKDGENYVPATGLAVENTTYYAAASATITDEQKKLDTLTGEGIYSASSAIIEEGVKYCYVRSADVQSTGATLKLAFSADIPTNP